MGANLGCGKLPGDFKIPKFSDKSLYLTKTLPNDHQLSSVMQQIAPANDSPNVKNIATYILECPDLVFSDSNFEHLDDKVKTSNKLSKLYNYKRQSIDRLYSSQPTSLNSISQH